MSDSDEAAEEKQSDSYVPELEPVDMDAMLNSHTDFYFYHAEEGEEVPADSAEIADWRKAADDAILSSTDLVKMHLAYTIPAGSLNETNPSARYRLPSNLHLSDRQIKAMNSYENGIAAGYRDSGSVSDTSDASDMGKENKENEYYQKYLGAEAVEGDRRPDEQLKEGAQEYISAVVRAENVYDDNGEFLGQDLIFTFVPYSIEKNRNTYDADKTLVSAGEKITGWFACDFKLNQIDWEEEKTARITFVQEDQDKKIEEISRVLKMDGEIGDGTSSETMTDVPEETGEDQDDQVFKAGTLTFEEDDYSITLDYGEEAKIPENASLSVREITAETDKEAYESCLEQAGQQVAADDKTSVDQEASRFFDIEILVTETDSDRTEKTVKIEPSAPVSVHIQINDKPASQESKPDQNDPTVLHFAEEGVEQIESDSTVTDSKNNNVEEQKTEIRFEAESFSVYGVVYTVDFHWEVDGKKYDFSIPGGGFVSLEHLVEMLGIGVSDTNTEDVEDGSEEDEMAAGNEEAADDSQALEDDSVAYDEAIKLNEAEVSESTKRFVEDVENVVFSSPELVWVGKADEEVSIGELKEANGLKVRYSSELTKEQIKEINSQTVKAGDWALISIHSFTSEEMLTVTMKNGDQWSIRVTDYVQGAYGQSVNIDIYGDGSITLGEYVHPFDWDWWGTYDHEERRTYYSYRNLSLSVRYGSNTNNQDIVANPAVGYTFDHWELTDGWTGNVTTYTSPVITAGTVSFSHGSTLTAVFSKSSGGGSVEPIDFNQITQEWIEKITKDQPVVDKSASVYDYENRIYQIDVTASSELYAVNQNLDIDFVADVSGSMHFPSKLDSVASFNYAAEMSTQLDNVCRENHHGTLPNSTPIGELYYMILDPQGASNVFVLRRYNGQWWALPGDTLDQIDLNPIRGRGYDNWRPLNVADNNGTVVYTNLSYPDPVNGGYYNPIVEKKIYMATDSTLRMEYLKQALYLARDVLYKINPDAQIGLTTFAATANQGQFYGSSQQAALTAAIEDITTQGGTNQAEGLAQGQRLLDSDPDTTKKKVAVLITDGAPNGCTWEQILQNAQNMKNDNIDVYAIGLSVENVQGASDGLFHTSNGAGFAFDAKDGRGLVEATESIIESIVKKANMIGSVSDTIDPAFYPVAKDGTPLQPGVEYEDENGNKYTVTQNGETWAVNWNDQSIGWAYTDMEGDQPGWKGTVYVKAKENFLGGNAIKTNSGTNNDNVTVSGFETFTYNDDDELVILNRGDLKDENGQSRTVTKPLKTPYVNVDELSLTGNDTEWKVYLGTEVDPKSALEELLKKVDIRKVVSGDTNEMITSSSQMLGGTSALSKTMKLTDYLGLDTDDEITALVTELLSRGSKTCTYDNSNDAAYGHGFVGDIVITLENTSGCYNKDDHETEAVGKDAEFTLKVKYQPRTNAERNSDLEITNDDYHTTPNGSAGTPVPKTGNDMTSSNHHVINVYAKGLQIRKKDQPFTNEITGAEFKLYRTARTDETENLKEINGKQFFPAATLDMTSGSIASIEQVVALREGEEYYLVETKAPEGYIQLEDPIPVNLVLTNSYTPKPGDTVSSAKPETGPYNWTQSSKLTLGSSPWVRRTDETGENNLTQAALDADSQSGTMYYDIANNAGAELPAAGGPGTTLIYLLGIMLAGIVGVVLVMRKCRRKAQAV